MDKFIAFCFGSRYKVVSTIATGIVLLFGSLLAFADGYERWDSAGFPTIATRAWSRLLRPASVINLEIDTARGKLEAAEGRRDVLELDYLRQPTEEGKVLNKQKQRKEQETIEKLKDQIKTLEQEKK